MWGCISWVCFPSWLDLIHDDKFRYKMFFIHFHESERPYIFFSYYKSAYCQFFTNEIFYLLQILVSNFLIRQILNGQDVVFFSIFTCPSSQYCTSNIFQIKYFYFMIFSLIMISSLFSSLFFLYLSLSPPPSYFSDMKGCCSFSFGWPENFSNLSLSISNLLGLQTHITSCSQILFIYFLIFSHCLIYVSFDYI